MALLYYGLKCNFVYSLGLVLSMLLHQSSYVILRSPLYCLCYINAPFIFLALRCNLRFILLTAGSCEGCPKKAIQNKTNWTKLSWYYQTWRMQDRNHAWIYPQARAYWNRFSIWHIDLWGCECRSLLEFVFVLSLGQVPYFWNCFTVIQDSIYDDG